ncbi:MAG: hypothetical protein JO248_03455 [Acidimicrobiia bacterium]|nr:hypothetical protein [Acidimicrobiia bacterium]
MNEQRDTQTQRDRRRRLAPWAARVAAVSGSIALMSVLVVGGSRAAFNATTSNGPNSFAAGTVVIGNDSTGSVMFNLSGMKPGTTATECINVTYTGSLTANVHMYGTAVSGAGTLADYLNTTIDIGTGAAGGAGHSCTGFVLGSNLFPTATLTSFGTTNTNFATGLAGNDGATNPTTKSYRVTVTLQDNNAAQGKTANASFTWEAQNT